MQGNAVAVPYPEFPRIVSSQFDLTFGRLSFFEEVLIDTLQLKCFFDLATDIEANH